METTTQALNRDASPSHDQGQTVDRVDQLSSITLLGLAIVGAILAVGLSALTH